MPPLLDMTPFRQAARRRSPAAGRTVRTLGCVMIVALTLVWTRPAGARTDDRPPTAEEQRSFAEGMRLLQTGDAVGAARAFQAGYDAGHDPAFLVRLGEAQEKAGAPAAAAESYQRYLRESPGAADRDDIAARVQRLLPGTPVAGNATSENGKPAAAPAAAGNSSIAPQAATPVASGAPAPIPVAPAEDEEESLRAFRDENPTPHTRLNVAAWIGTGVTVALLGVTAFYGAKAGDKASDVNRLTSNFDPTTDLPVEYATVANRYKDAVRDGKHDDRMAKGFAIAAGATALTTAALFIIDAVRNPGDAGGKAHAGVTPMVTAQGTGLGLGGTF